MSCVLKFKVVAWKVREWRLAIRGIVAIVEARSDKCINVYLQVVPREMRENLT